MMDRRKLEEQLVKAIMIAATLLVSSSLVLILVTILWKGLPVLTVEMLTKTPEGGYYIGKGGGILNAILGSIVVGLAAIALASLTGLPVALYLNVYVGRKSKMAVLVRFALDTLWGIPSIVYGAFGFTIMVMLGMQASLLAAIITVALLVFPITVRGMDEVLQMVPDDLKEASFALGSTNLETAGRVVMRRAFPGLLTAVLVAFGRGIGDAASVLFTAGFTDSLPHSLFGPVATLPLAIFFQLGTPFPEVQARGYASALVLTAIVLAISLTCRTLMRRSSRSRS